MNILMKHKRLIDLSEVNYSVEDTVEAVLFQILMAVVSTKYFVTEIIIIL